MAGFATGAGTLVAVAALEIRPVILADEMNPIGIINCTLWVEGLQVDLEEVTDFEREGQRVTLRHGIGWLGPEYLQLRLRDWNRKRLVEAWVRCAS